MENGMVQVQISLAEIQDLFAKELAAGVVAESRTYILDNGVKKLISTSLQEWDGKLLVYAPVGADLRLAAELAEKILK